MLSNREKIIAGEVAMIANELTTLSEESLQRVYLGVGQKRWQTLTKALVKVERRTEIKA